MEFPSLGMLLYEAFQPWAPLHLVILPAAHQLEQASQHSIHKVLHIQSFQKK